MQLPGLDANTLNGAVVDMDNRTCVVCGSEFLPGHPRIVACSQPCKHERHKQISREHARRKYTPRVADPRDCAFCGGTFTPEKRSDAIYCRDLCKHRAQQQRKEAARRPSRRMCHKCGVSEVERKPGKPVCESCRADKRDPVKAAAKERRRRFRTYGITEDDYNRMLAAQGHRCGICRTDTPGAKGWAIDHCHESDMVRGILCSACNSAIGLLKENPAVIERAAEYVRQHTQIRLVV